MPEITDLFQQELEPGDIFLYASNSRILNLRVGVFISSHKQVKMNGEGYQVKVFFIDPLYLEGNLSYGVMNEIDSLTFSTKAFKLVHPEFYIDQILIQHAYAVIDQYQGQIEKHD